MWRIYDDAAGYVNRDYWALNMNENSAPTRAINSSGRYVYASIKKSQAANMFMYITINGQNIYLYKGDNVVTHYGGLPVYMDNAYFETAQGKKPISNYASDPNWFITGWYDTGDTETKSYTLLKLATQIHDAAWRLYNNKTGDTCINWWPSCSSQEEKAFTYSTAGQLILFSVYKPRAADMYLYCNTTGKYIFKGNNVT